MSLPDDIYRNQILDHYRNPRNFGQLKKATHVAELQNVDCGDVIRLYAVIEKDTIKKISFTGTGCAISIAAASLLCESAEGEKISVIKKLGKKDVEKMLGITISKIREQCAMLGLQTIGQLQKINKKQGKKH